MICVITFTQILRLLRDYFVVVYVYFENMCILLFGFLFYKINYIKLFHSNIHVSIPLLVFYLLIQSTNEKRLLKSSKIIVDSSTSCFSFINFCFICFEALQLCVYHNFYAFLQTDFFITIKCLNLFC